MKAENSLYCGSSLHCSLSIENIGTPNNPIARREVFRSAELIIGRNQVSELIIQLNCEKFTRIYLIENVAIHRRFVSEGKCSLSFPKENVQILVSNCAPDKLIFFLKTLIGKMAKDKANPNLKITARDRLFSLASKENIIEVSPLCDADVESLKRVAPASTPTSGKSKKRLRDDDQLADKENTSSLVKRNLADTTSLTSQQYKVLEAITAGHNVFFTGSAGTGKSFLLKRALGLLPPECTFVTASTGIAASHISGMTLHSFAGIGSGNADLDKCIEMASRPVVASQWKKCRHLIIDEVSMVSAEYFSKLEAVARVVRKRDEPFGGIQLIICGDFFQLPPVEKRGGKDKKETKFSFETKAWMKCVQVIIQLKEVKRQTDNVFINLLQQLRKGVCPPDVSKILKSTSKHALSSNGVEATILSTHNDDVETINELSLSKLSGDLKEFTSIDNDTSMTSKINELCPACSQIKLKIGAQVMLCKNISTKEGLVNGSRGVVIAFDKAQAGFPVVKMLDGRTHVIKPESFTFKWSGGITLVRRQLPIKLAWAISIHKSQGMTLDLVEMSLSRTFEYGQAYVALSRARTLKGLRVIDFSPECVKAHPKVIEYYKSIENDEL